MQRPHHTSPSYRETSTLKYFSIEKYYPTFIIIANKCMWTHDSYAQYAPLQNISTPEDRSAFPIWIPDERIRSIQKHPKFTEYIRKYLIDLEVVILIKQVFII